MNSLHEFTAEPMIAYFSMEIGVKNDIPTYSGGLGILAGDTIKSAADLKLPARGRDAHHPQGLLYPGIRQHGLAAGKTRGLGPGQST